MTATKKKRGLNGRTSPAPGTTRVAIYCRKSVADRDQEFGSIDAQREAVEAYVTSQRGEGWVALPERYDDDGHTGANTDRPAFQRLLRDVQAGEVDVVAVYKIDRLSRSLADFTRLMEAFEEHGVTFVSVTQQFNSTSSMGRLTLNILMSFAEFERETIAERTRDKILASRRRGMWTGGRPVLGYDVVEKKLVVNEEEAESVRAIFALYLELGTLLVVVDELKRRGWGTKTWTNKRGETVHGRAFTKTSLYSLLTNPLYVGKMRAADELAEGAHAAIVDETTWRAVQKQLRDHGAGRASGPRRKHDALLAGLAYCACGSAMSPHHTKKGDRRYAYYVCSRHQKEGAAACPGSRVAAGDLEAFVVEQLQEVGRDPKVLEATVEADRRDREARRPELAVEARRLAIEKGTLEADRANLVDAVAKGNGDAPSTLMGRIAELDEEIADVGHRLDEAQGELAALELGALDADALRATLSDLEPIWGELFPKERARLLALLLERVEFDAAEGEVGLTFRPGGPKAVHRRNGGSR